MLAMEAEGQEGSSRRERAARSRELADEITTLAAHIHAANARLAALVAELDELREWPEHGVRSPEHWLTINTGLDLWAGRELVRVGHALEELPKVREAFESGRLSLDKTRALTRVASSEDEAEWLSMAAQMSGNQLSRLCRAYGRAMDNITLGEDTARHRRRSLRTWWRADGMLQVVAEMPPEDGRLFLEALEAAIVEPTPADGPVQDRALDAWGARRVDALTHLCERALTSLKADRAPRAANRQLVVHVDFDLLVGLKDRGRCHVEDGPSIALETAERLGCDAQVVAMIERQGQVLDVRPARRLHTTSQRRALAARDATCVLPGCGAPAVDCEPHHLRAFSRGGPTIMRNSASTCAFHHGEYHRGAFRIIDLGKGRFRFETPDGRPIQPPPKKVRPAADVRAQDEADFLTALARTNGLEISADTPRAEGGGAWFDFAHAVSVMAQNHELNQLRPTGPGP